MIDEAIGKILGMAMAYGASALGMFVAYVNYRKRIVKAEKVMTPTAWVVILISVLAVGVAVLVVFQIAGAPTESPAPEVAKVAQPEVQPEMGLKPTFDRSAEERETWPLVGIVVPGVIFLFATWITAALHRHFSRQGPGH